MATCGSFTLGYDKLLYQKEKIKSSQMLRKNSNQNNCKLDQIRSN